MARFLLCCMILAGAASKIDAQDILRPYMSISFSVDAIVQFSLDENRFIVVEPGLSLTVYETGADEPLLTLPVKDKLYIRQVYWAADNSTVLLMSPEILYRLDIATGTLTQSMMLTGGKLFTWVKYYQNDAILAVARQNMGSSLDYPDVYVLDAVTLKQRFRLPFTEDCAAATRDNPAVADIVRFLNGLPNQADECFPYILWNPDHTRYLTWVFWNSGSPHPIRVYDGATGKRLFSLSHCPAADNQDGDCDTTADLEEVVWSPDGTKIASLPEYVRDNVTVWDAQTGALLQSLPARVDETGYDGYEGVAWNGEGQIAAWGVGTIYVWDVATGQRLFDWSHAENVVYGIEWLREGRLAVTWGEGVPWSQTVGEVWNAATGENLALIASSTSSIRQVIDKPELYSLYVVFQNRIEAYDMETLMKVWKLDGQ